MSRQIWIQYSNETCEKWEIRVIDTETIKTKLEICGLFLPSRLHIILFYSSPISSLIPHPTKEVCIFSTCPSVFHHFVLFFYKETEKMGERSKSLYCHNILMENSLNMCTWTTYIL